MPPVVVGLVATAVGAGVALSSAEKQARALDKAGKRQEAAAIRAQEIDEERFGPFREAGERALAKLESGEPFDVSATFEPRLETETKALVARLSAAGLERGGRGMRAISELTRTLSGEEQDLQFGRLLSIARLGAGAARGVDPGPQISAIGAQGEAETFVPQQLAKLGEGLGGIGLTLGKFFENRKRKGLFSEQSGALT